MLCFGFDLKVVLVAMVSVVMVFGGSSISGEDGGGRTGGTTYLQLVFISPFILMIDLISSCSKL